MLNSRFSRIINNIVFPVDKQLEFILSRGDGIHAHCYQSRGSVIKLYTTLSLRCLPMWVVHLRDPGALPRCYRVLIIPKASCRILISPGSALCQGRPSSFPCFKICSNSFLHLRQYNSKSLEAVTVVPGEVSG